eukprot:TRINITY_DN12976_c0_g1_i1.p1 TRINITY_DN12976_c0_g1~~TRINITY_DN12976_c0_g1_i1.p1  ORF type:complete len:167 (+),score=19.14 TRINITY_DN12976_c0_g1_i1:258-758(+)
MRSRAVLRLCGGFASALILLLAFISFFADFLSALADGELFTAMHHLACCGVLGTSGGAMLLAEIRPHPAVSQNAPYLDALRGRAFVYMTLGMYIVGRHSLGGLQMWVNRFIGLYVLVVAAVSMAISQRLQNLPPALSEPALREMQGAAAQHSQHVQPPEMPSAAFY